MKLHSIVTLRFTSKNLFVATFDSPPPPSSLAGVRVKMIIQEMRDSLVTNGSIGLSFKLSKEDCVPSAVEMQSQHHH